MVLPLRLRPEAAHETEPIRNVDCDADDYGYRFGLGY